MQVPPLFEKEPMRDKLQRLPGGPTQPLTVHLRQEIDRLNTVLVRTAATLRNLRLAIAGALPHVPVGIELRGTLTAVSRLTT